jgi:alkaline phosphatase D
MWLDLRGLTPPPLNQLFIVDADTWDGYPSHRAELMSFLKTQNIGNVVAISGDVHAFQCGVVRDNPDPALGTPVALDLVGAGISSTAFFQVLQARLGSSPLSRLLPAAAAFDALLRANNPDLAFVDLDAQGYASATLTPGALTVLFNKVKPLNADGSKPAQPLAKRTRITLQAGSLAPRIEDNVG